MIGKMGKMSLGETVCDSQMALNFRQKTTGSQQKFQAGK